MNAWKRTWPSATTRRCRPLHWNGFASTAGTECPTTVPDLTSTVLLRALTTTGSLSIVGRYGLDRQSAEISCCPTTRERRAAAARLHDRLQCSGNSTTRAGGSGNSSRLVRWLASARRGGLRQLRRHGSTVPARRAHGRRKGDGGTRRWSDCDS